MIVTTLSPEAARRLRNGATFVPREEVLSIQGTPATGEPVQLLDSDGRPLGFGDFDAEGPVAVRRLGLPSDQADGFVPRQLRRALRRRAQLVDDPRYCRVVNDEGDGLPGLVVDRFEGHFAVQTTTRAMGARLDEIARTLVAVAGARSVILRNDGERRAAMGLEPERTRVLYGLPPRWTRLLELGARITIDLHQGRGTGYSYALREVRRAMARLAPNARVLDPSCFVGGAVVQAGLHGGKLLRAFSADFDDAELARENLEANGLMSRSTIEQGSPREALSWLKESFDLVLLHAPPRGSDPGEWTRELDELIRLAVRATRHGGRLCLTAADAALGHEPLEEHVLSACENAGRAAYRLLRPAAPADFPASAGAPDAQASVVLELS